MNQILVQMHGHPGSGKSALARALGAALPAVVVDKDVIASALIRHGLPFSEAGAPSYQVMYAQAERFLEDGHSVVMDSPCFWPRIEEMTRNIAANAGANWAMVECRCREAVRDQRLEDRVRLESNPAERDRGPMRPGMYEPSCDRLVVDSERAMADLLAEVLAHLRSMTGERPIANSSPNSAEEGIARAQVVAS